MNAEIEAKTSQIEILKDLIAKNEITSEALAARVVLYRALGMYKDVAVLCMSELARRRANGDTFDFESYIETEVTKIPKIDVSNFQQLSNSFTMQAIAKLIKK